MRKAYNDFSIISDDNSFYGISLGYDYCAEHEWGIKGIQRSFGINNDLLGVDGRTITKNAIRLFENKNYYMLTSYYPSWRNKELSFDDLIPYEGLNKTLSTFWDEDNFMIVLDKNDINKKYVDVLMDAFSKNDIIIARIQTSVPVFSNASLSVLIKSNLPKDAINSMYNSDKMAKNLIEYEENIGLAKLKSEKRGDYGKNHYFMACSPHWIRYNGGEKLEEEKKKKKTEYDIMYWVNYSDDDDNYGWYSVESIREWLSTDGMKLKNLPKI
mgnify:CR=1 FL=1